MIINLNGKWKMRETGSEKYYDAKVPGCNYLDLLDSGVIKDPFIGVNEKEYLWVAEKDWEYARDFICSEDLLKFDRIELVMDCLDTLASVFLNDSLILTANNAHRKYAVDIKPFLVKGGNTVKVIFLSPVNYIREGQRIANYPKNSNGLDGIPHIRKPQCHFGWDWGPVLPPSGISGNIFIKAVNKAKIIDVRVVQEHFQNKVRLDVEIINEILNKEDDLINKIKVTSPDGKVIEASAVIKDEKVVASFEIENPEIWEANGMSKRDTQPLYQVEAQTVYKNEVLDEKSLKVGLRTLSLNTTPDKWGHNFQFVVNGIPVFARGANWIPADSFYTKLTKEKVDYLVRSARDANMNMLRVWGGGYYESDDFYEACDKYGIMVWQDFGFACMPYDFDNDEFIKNLKEEVTDNVIRLRNHPSLALWSGNNEIELICKLWLYKRHFINSAEKFFYRILPEWVEILDGITPYWYGSPSSGRYLYKVNSDKFGDTHLWQVWHGLKPYNYYRRRFSRFCSEFGFESIPDIETVEGFAKEKDYDMDSEVMKNHQKCKSGNSKILFYMTTRFRIPKKFSDLVYLSQISQTECVRDATEHFRRNMNRCNGALFWQLNDCWPVNSWSSIDYNGRWKALQYEARKFNAPVALSIDDKGSVMKVSVTNDTIEHFSGTFNWKVITFDGKVLDGGSSEINAIPLSSDIIFEKDFKEAVKDGLEKKSVFICDLNGDLMTRRTALFVKEKDAEFIKPHYSTESEINDGKAIIRIKSDTFAKFVMVKVKGVNTPLSDNYFDLIPNEEKIITVDAKGLTAQDIKVSLLSYNELEPKQSRFKDNVFRLKVRLTPVNILFAIAQMFT